jgi:hypothetical protein
VVSLSLQQKMNSRCGGIIITKNNTTSSNNNNTEHKSKNLARVLSTLGTRNHTLHTLLLLVDSMFAIFSCFVQTDDIFFCHSSESQSCLETNQTNTVVNTQYDCCEPKTTS